MKHFFEFIPLLIFFSIYKLLDIYAATASLILATGLMLAFSYLKNGTVKKMHLITFLMVLVFGAFTLILHDDLFIKWKISIVYALFAIALWVSQMTYKKPIIKQMLAKEITLADNIWNKINNAWALFFSTLSALNLYVAFNLSQQIWLNFKVFGLLGLTLAFTVLTGLYIYKNSVSTDNKQNED